MHLAVQLHDWTTGHSKEHMWKRYNVRKVSGNSFQKAGLTNRLQRVLGVERDYLLSRFHARIRHSVLFCRPHMLKTKVPVTERCGILMFVVTCCCATTLILLSHRPDPCRDVYIASLLSGLNGTCGPNKTNGYPKGRDKIEANMEQTLIHKKYVWNKKSAR
ncbi:uncharacterized protein BDR25DRAFT_354715 [Lindgomyces ingoldianus]|uniref:Uncharacterized protein n=1 Tax=Lindgomyces ingoldianus TaxID=673940 RepID=A0ACB6QXD9_9PLEO|nr:uncharacterized protein BDR25DRAFT_354715 [Lindgomyces ingoldianus]KAF2471467.1 hypothetical protein BDR25DRAFT_354715 [Lindgomyces ingoldianus]